MSYGLRVEDFIVEIAGLRELQCPQLRFELEVSIFSIFENYLIFLLIATRRSLVCSKIYKIKWIFKFFLASDINFTTRILLASAEQSKISTLVNGAMYVCTHAANEHVLFQRKQKKIYSWSLSDGAACFK